MLLEVLLTLFSLKYPSLCLHSTEVPIAVGVLLTWAFGHILEGFRKSGEAGLTPTV